MVYIASRLSGSFGGVRKLQRYSRWSEREVKKFLPGQNAYTLHKPRRIRFPRRRTYSKGIGDIFQIDLVDLTSLSSFNDGMRYLLTCIDVFSKRAWAVPVARKSARDVVEAFEKILADQKCTMIQSDKCTKFLNSSFQSMLKLSRRRHNPDNEGVRLLPPHTFSLVNGRTTNIVHSV